MDINTGIIMPSPSTTILSLDAQLSLLYAIALHYDTELSNLYHELFMKSLKDEDTRKINLDDIQKERRIVEYEIKGRVSSIYDKEEKLMAKGRLILNCTTRLKSVQSILPLLCGGGESMMRRWYLPAISQEQGGIYNVGEDSVIGESVINNHNH